VYYVEYRGYYTINRTKIKKKSDLKYEERRAKYERGRREKIWGRSQQKRAEKIVAKGRGMVYNIRTYRRFAKKRCGMSG
jgi:hypothetical protein